MPLRKTPLISGEIYHVFNRTIGNEKAFIEKENQARAVRTIQYYHCTQKTRYSFIPKKEEITNVTETAIKLVEIYAFTLMSNHYHVLLKQLVDRGIKTFISNFQNSFAKYYNIRINRYGGLFQSPFKAKLVKTTEQFIHISRYVHLNPVTSSFIQFNQLSTIQSNSFIDYCKESPREFINTKRILTEFGGSIEKYKKFVRDNVDYQRKLNRIKHLLLD